MLVSAAIQQWSKFVSKYRFIVLSNPVTQRDAEFNEWYDKVHIPELTALKGVKSATRLRILPERPWKYMAEYEVECENLRQWMAYLAAEQKKMAMSESFDSSSMMTLFAEAI
jgi:hypothetical protein